MPAYTNAYKGRANRQESASHLKDEFDRIEAAFIVLQESNSSYSDIYNHGDSTEYVRVDPANGQMQEITLTRDTLIEIQDPGSESNSESRRLTLIVHGANYKIINGWGPQTWKEQGDADWMWLYTGKGEKAGATLEFAFDGLAWCCLAFTRNSFDDFNGITTMFPLISDLWNSEKTVELTWVRSSYGWTFDIDATGIMVPDDMPRFFGGRYVKNWVATPRDLQSVAWETDGATVTTSSGGGQDGGDVDQIEFLTTDGEVRTWFLPHFGRSSEASDTFEFVISFDARMSTVPTGTCRAVIAIMGVDSGSVVRWDRKEFNLTNEWNSFGAVLDPVLGKDLAGFNLNTPAGARTLVKFAIESPSDGVGSAIRIENVNVVIVKEGDDLKPSLPIASTIGSSMTLVASPGSTGTWDDGTKTMSMTLGQDMNFETSLEIGQSYLCVARRSAGNSANVLMENDRVYWTAYSKISGDQSFVRDAPFTFQYEGGVFKFFQSSQSSEYIVNIYKIDDYMNSYGTENANVINEDGTVTYTEGQQISSNIAVGVGYEKNPGINLLPDNFHRDFSLWTKSHPMRVRRSEFGMDGRPSHGTMIEDNSIGGAAYIFAVAPITDDTQEYFFSFFIRKTVNPDGTTRHASQLSPAAGGPVTDPSKFLDFKMVLYNLADPENGNLVDGAQLRVDVATGRMNAPANIYTSIYAVNFQHWTQVTVGLTNNGLGNDTAALVILPCCSRYIDVNVGLPEVEQKGYAIIDWVQLEENTAGQTQSATIPGSPRAADVISTTLDDGILYTGTPTEVGDVTSAVFNFDTREIYKNITWVKS